MECTTPHFHGLHCVDVIFLKAYLKQCIRCKLMIMPKIDVFYWKAIITIKTAAVAAIMIPSPTDRYIEFNANKFVSILLAVLLQCSYNCRPISAKNHVEITAFFDSLSLFLDIKHGYRNCKHEIQNRHAVERKKIAIICKFLRFIHTGNISVGFYFYRILKKKCVPNK